MALVAGIDSSTQATKVLVVDSDDGRIVAQGHSPHPSTTPPCSEQHPESWWSALNDAWAQCGAAAARVEAVAVAGQQHGLVALDRDGLVVHPAKLWNDMESAPQAARLVAEIGAEQFAARTGSVPLAAFTISKLAWLRDTRPDAFGRIHRVLLPHDWLTWRLLGMPDRAVTDRGDASGTGWWSPAADAYDVELLGLAGGRVEWLPEVLGPIASAGVATEVAPGALVGAGTGDNMAAALGLALGPRRLALSLGTSGTAFSVAGQPTADATGAVAGFADATGRFLPLVCTTNCTKVTDWALGLLGASSADLDGIVSGASPAADRRTHVAVLPHFDGERTPNRPDATGTIVGITTATTGADIVAAAVVGVVCSLLDGADALGVAGAEHDGPIIVVGGGSVSRAYRQAIADLAQRPVMRPTATDQWVAYGAAAQAAACLAGITPESVGGRWVAGASHDVAEPQMSSADAFTRRAQHAALIDANVNR